MVGTTGERGTGVVVEGEAEGASDGTGRGIRLFRVLRVLLDGPLPEEWLAGVAGVSEAAMGRVLRSLEGHGVLVLGGGGTLGRRVVGYAPGSGEVVRRMFGRHESLRATGMAVGEEEAEMFAGLLGVLGRLERSVGGRNAEGGDAA